jgi:hypothetical protein
MVLRNVSREAFHLDGFMHRGVMLIQAQDDGGHGLYGQCPPREGRMPEGDTHIPLFYPPQRIRRGEKGDGGGLLVKRIINPIISPRPSLIKRGDKPCGPLAAWLLASASPPEAEDFQWGRLKMDEHRMNADNGATVENEKEFGKADEHKKGGGSPPSHFYQEKR